MSMDDIQILEEDVKGLRVRLSNETDAHRLTKHNLGNEIKDLKTQLGTMTTDRDRLNDKCTKLQDEVTQLRTERASIKTDLGTTQNSMGNKVSELTKASNVLQSEKNDAMKKLQALQQAHDELTKDRNGLADTLNKLEVSHHELRKKHEALSAAETRLKADNADLTSEINQMKGKVQTEVQSRNTTNAEAQDAVRKLENKLADTKALLSTVTKEKDKLADDKARVDAELKEMKAQSSDLKTDLAANKNSLGSQVDELTRKLTLANKTIAEMEAKAKQTDIELREATRERNELADLKQRLETERDTLKDKLGKEQALNTRHEASIKDLTKETKRLQTSLEAEVKARGDADRKFQDERRKLTAQVTDAKGKLSIVTKENSTWTTQKTKLESQVKQLKDQKGELERANKKLEVSNKEQLRQLKALSATKPTVSRTSSKVSRKL